MSLAVSFSTFWYLVLILAHVSSTNFYFKCILGGEDEIKKECLMCPPGVIAHPLSFQDGIKLPLENTEGFELVLASEDMDYL